MAVVSNLNTIASLTYHMNYYAGAAIKVLQGEPLEAKDEYSFNLPPVQSRADWEKLLKKTWSDGEKFAQLIEQLPDFGLPDERIRLFPNPASASCKISSAESPVSLDVYTITGTRVFSTRLHDKLYTLTLNDFSEGFFLLSLTDRDGKISRRKLLVAR